MEKRLPENWISTFDQKGVHCLLISPGDEKAIQRRVTVDLEGKVTVAVHCKLLSDIHKFTGGIVCNLPPQEIGDVQEFSSTLVQIVCGVSAFDVCRGADPKCDFVHVWKSGASAYIDENPHLENSYVRTLRAKQCGLLVNKRYMKCTCCSKLYNALTKRRISSDSDDFSISTTNVRLSDQQKMQKLQRQQREIRSLKQALQRLGKTEFDLEMLP